MDQKGLWQAVLGELEVTVSRANFSTWFRDKAIISQEEGHIVIGVPNLMTKNWLEAKFHNDIKTTLGKMHGGIQTIEYKVGSKTGGTALAQAKPSSPKRTETTTIRGSQTSLPISAVAATSHNLNPRYTFETFVVGSSNEFAHAACQAVAKDPGTKYNPLFLYGGTGLGKTHLMQAVGNEIHRRDSGKRIEYITSESFTNEFISGIMKKKAGAFAEKYRAVDVLIIDDIQFLARAEKTQDEFFHTFNALHQANKQIIISSDKPPQALMGLEERLRSRCEAGITVDIQPPDLETRSAILQTKANAQGIL
jgi:chromosomal replication initiator protein